MANTLQKHIMRRVYYSYILSISTIAALWQGIVLGSCIALFGRLTHVAAIYRNISSVPLKNTPDFVFNAFSNAFALGEILTVLVALFIMILSVYFIKAAVSVLALIGKFRTA